MKYFKNTELAKIYNVSEKTVRNWVQASKDDKLDLQLYKKDDKLFIANVSKNTYLIEQLVQKGKKYKNSRGQKIVRPKKEFYEVYTQKQIVDITSSLTIRKEIPLQYGYANGGADFWDNYASRLITEDHPNILTTTIGLLDMTANNIDQLCKDHSKVNVVDLGPGNGLPVRSTLERLVKQKKMGRYIAIDISKEMLAIVETNIKEWFGGAVAYEGHVRDFSYERFDDLITDRFGDGDGAANLVLLLGGTLNNFRSPNQVLQNVNNSLGLNDLFVYSGYLDTPYTRRYFDFNAARGGKHRTQASMLVIDFLNIDESLYDLKRTFSEEQGGRSGLMRPNVDIIIELELADRTARVELKKNEPILVWRHRHYNITELARLLDENDFDLLQATKSKDQNYILLTANLKTSR
jgi:uncharacterized SAM-dependent methyltransferase